MKNSQLETLLPVFNVKTKATYSLSNGSLAMLSMLANTILMGLNNFCVKLCRQ